MYHGEEILKGGGVFTTVPNTNMLLYKQNEDFFVFMLS